MKYSKESLVTAAYLTLVVAFCFMYFVVYRTERRAAWYTEMQQQSEGMFREFRDAVGIDV